MNRPMSPIEGFFIVDKPPGVTSHDVVARIRRLLRPLYGKVKVGHAGTLDPAATGVLPVAVGRATRLVDELHALPKAYRAEWIGGTATDTDDATGRVVEQRPADGLSPESVRRAFQAFVGEIAQVPPMVSAVKVGGRRLYERARRGETVSRSARRVRIYSLDILAMDLMRPDPRVHFQVRCSAGTYIRTLCADIGRALGVPAHMGRLVRTDCAGFALDRAVTPEALEAAATCGTLERHLVPMAEALAFMPAVTVDAAVAQRVLNGHPLPPPDDPKLRGLAPGAKVAVYDPSGVLLAVYRVADDGAGRNAPMRAESHTLVSRNDSPSDPPAAKRSRTGAVWARADKVLRIKER